MTVKELIAALRKWPNKDDKVGWNHTVPGTGCDTCGFDAVVRFTEVTGVHGLEGAGEVELE